MENMDMILGVEDEGEEDDRRLVEVSGGGHPL